MTPLSEISGPAAPLMEANVNTDVIIRIERLSDYDRDALEPFAFEAWRFDAEGNENSDYDKNDLTNGVEHVLFEFALFDFFDLSEPLNA